MKIGFTGTQHGCTAAQKQALGELLAKINPFTEFHHGDCIGADSQAHSFVERRRDVALHVHPGVVDSRKRAFRRGVMYAPMPPLDRNKVIVDTTIKIIACPNGMEEELRSGTWATIRYARKVGKPVHLVFNDGSSQCDDNWWEGLQCSKR